MSARADGGGLRLWVHAATGLAALALGLLPDPWHVVFAVGGVLAGWVVFPLTPIDRRLRRPGEPFFGGLRTYPLAVLGLVLLLPRAEAAAAWGVLACGDAAAAIVGRAVPAPAVFGHRKATWSGSAAYLLVGSVAAYGISRAVVALAGMSGAVEPGAGPAALACLAAAGAATVLDLVPLPPDDNLPAAASAGSALYLLRGLL